MAAADKIDRDLTGYSPWLHHIALITAVLTFPLIVLGGLVTSHGAGMSVPDWPTSYGYNMFLFPPKYWIGGIAYEHTHRLMATLVGLSSIVLTIAAWKLESRRWARWVATAVLGAIIFQGILGGLRVRWVKLDLAIVHACVAQAFFCLAALETVITSRWWWNTRADAENSIAIASVARIAVACVVLIYLQLIVGAVMRHYQAGLAIPDFPLSYDRPLPPMNQQDLLSDNQQRIWRLDLPAVTMMQVWIHFSHRIGALLVTIGVLMLASLILRRNKSSALVPFTWMLLMLLAFQLALGVLTVLYRRPADVTSAHVAVGALVLVTTFVIAARALRLYFLCGREYVSTNLPEANEPRIGNLHTA